MANLHLLRYDDWTALRADLLSYSNLNYPKQVPVGASSFLHITIDNFILITANLHVVLLFCTVLDL